MPAAAADLAAVARTTRDVYERNAARFDAERSRRLHERVWLDRFLALVPEEGRVLDLGCGTGDPIAAHLARCGRRVTGVDFSHAMLAIAAERFPDGDWRWGDMRALDLAERFDGVLGWDGFFHLMPDEQRSTLPRIASHLVPGGALLLTVGPDAGEALGRVGEDPVYHSSLSREEYGAVLAAHGVDVLRFVAEDPECDRRSLLLARKRAV